MATAKARAALAADVMNAAIDKMNLIGANLPEITEATWGSWVDGMLNSRYENQFYPTLLDTIFETIVSKAIYENSLKEYKAGFVANGAGVKETFIDKIDAMPYATTDVEKEELKTYLADIYESRYLINMERKYPVTLGRIDFRGYVSTPERVIDLIDDVKSMLYTSNEMDEYGLMKTMLQNYILQGKAYVVPVDMTKGLDDFATQFRAMSLIMKGLPKRDFNEFGVMNNTPLDRQVLFLSAKTAAQYSVDVLSSAFNMSQVDYVTRVEVMDDLDHPYSELPVLRQVNKNIPQITSEDTAILGKVVGVLMDRNFFKVYDVINEMWDKERASRMDVNYFLHIWQIYATSPFANFVIFVDNTAATTQPATITAKIVGKNITPAGVDFTIEVQRTANSLVGGGMNLVQTNDLAADGVLVTRTGLVRMQSGADDITLEGKIRDVNYKATQFLGLTAKAATASTAATVSNVGDTITFTKQ